MEAWRWVLLALLGVLVALVGLWLWPRSGELRAFLPQQPEVVCRSIQQVLAQRHYELSAANCKAAGGWIQAAITFIPDKSGTFIPDKSGSFRNELSFSLQGLPKAGTVLRLQLRSLRLDPRTGSWREDPHVPFFLTGQGLLSLLAQQLRGG